MQKLQGTASLSSPYLCPGLQPCVITSASLPAHTRPAWKKQLPQEPQAGRKADITVVTVLVLQGTWSWLHQTAPDVHPSTALSHPCTALSHTLTKKMPQRLSEKQMQLVQKENETLRVCTGKNLGVEKGLNAFH